MGKRPNRTSARAAKAAKTRLTSRKISEFGPIPDLLPDIRQTRPGPGAHLGAAEIADHQGGGDDGHDARNVQVMFADPEGQVGRGDRDGDLGEASAPQQGNAPADRVTTPRAQEPRGPVDRKD